MSWKLFLSAFQFIHILLKSKLTFLLTVHIGSTCTEEYHFTKMFFVAECGNNFCLLHLYLDPDLLSEDTPRHAGAGHTQPHHRHRPQLHALGARQGTVAVHKAAPILVSM